MFKTCFLRKKCLHSPEFFFSSLPRRVTQRHGAQTLMVSSQLYCPWISLEAAEEEK